MAGLLDAILSGQMPLQDDSPQGALLTDLLKRLEAGTAQPGSVGITPMIAQAAAPAPVEGVGRFAAPQLRAPEPAPAPAPAPAALPPLQTREVREMPVAGVPYQAPETPLPVDRQPAPAPAPTAPKAAPSPAPRGPAPGESEMTFAERLSALGRGYNKGGLIGAIGDMMGGSPEKADENLTVNALVKNFGVDRDTARAMTKSPQLAQLIFGKNGPPQIVKIPGPYGTEVDMVWNSRTRRLEPLSTLLGGDQPNPAAPALPAAPAAPAPPPVLGATPMAPAAPGPAPAAPGAPLAPGMPAPAAPIAKNVPATVGDDGQYVIGNAVPKPPEGYVHKIAPDGRGYLWSREGRPIFELKTEADARGKQREKDLEADDKRKKAGEQVSGAIEQLMRLPLDFGKQATERAIGPWSATNPNPDSAAGIWGTGISVGNLGQMIARGYGEAATMVEGGATPTEVRDRIETVTKNLAAVMKPLIRAPGEGAWSDKDQANLEAQIGMLTRSRTVEEYNRRLADIQENVGKVFRLNVPTPGTVTRRPDAPTPAEEEMTAIERLFGKQLK